MFFNIFQHRVSRSPLESSFIFAKCRSFEFFFGRFPSPPRNGLFFMETSAKTGTQEDLGIQLISNEGWVVLEPPGWSSGSGGPFTQPIEISWAGPWRPCQARMWNQPFWTQPGPHMSFQGDGRHMSSPLAWWGLKAEVIWTPIGSLPDIASLSTDFNVWLGFHIPSRDSEAKQIYESLQAGLFDMSSDAHGITAALAMLFEEGIWP